MKPLCLVILLGALLSLSGCAANEDPSAGVRANFYSLGLSHDPTVNGGFTLPPSVPSSTDPGNPNAYHPYYDKDDY